MTGRLRITIIFLAALAVYACRGEEPVLPSTETPITDGRNGGIKGFFLLNEGNMGSNKATLDYFDYESGVYSKNIFAERNPEVVKELGDVGNDLKIYGDKLYAVINCSNLVEVMDISTAKHITSVNIPNCRYLAFDGGYAYVSSYAGPVGDDLNARPGYVAKIDTTSFEIVATCLVGRQPEEMAIAKGKLYVANSGGYTPDNYERTVSVIDLATFTEAKRIDVGPNLHRMRLDEKGKLWITARGDYRNSGSETYVIDTETDEVTNELPLLPASNIAIYGERLYAFSTEWNPATQRNTVTYAIVDTAQEKVVSRNFITDGSEKKIIVPYALAVNPESGEILVGDARDYITPGTLHCYSGEGKLEWSVTTGDIPSSIAFTTKKLKPLGE